MTDDIARPPRVHDIQPKDIEAFLSAINAKGLACPVCTNESWGFIYSPIGHDGEIQAYSLARTSGTGADLYAQGHFPLVVLTCDRCGYVRLHQRERLEAWLDARLPTPPDAPR